MSIKTWKEEFYPTPVDKKMSAKEAIEHSLKKWEGLKAANLKRHGVQICDSWTITDGDYLFSIDYTTCALCKKYYLTATALPCGKCPLNITLHGVCDNDGMPYEIWQRTHNTTSMIKALKKTLARLESGEST